MGQVVLQKLTNMKVSNQILHGNESLCMSAFDWLTIELNFMELVLHR